MLLLFVQDGGFYSAEDADSLSAEHKKEGAFCVWSQQEINSLLPDATPTNPSKTWADVFSYHYGVKPQGNVDPHKVRGGASLRGGWSLIR